MLAKQATDFQKRLFHELPQLLAASRQHHLPATSGNPRQASLSCRRCVCVCVCHPRGSVAQLHPRVAYRISGMQNSKG